MNKVKIYAALEYLLKYLEHHKKAMIIQYKGIVLKNVIILDHYISYNEDILFLFLENEHEMEINISNFHKIKFDTMTFDAENILEIQRMLKKMNQEKYWNVYFLDCEDKFVLEFISIADRKIRIFK